MQVGAAPCSTCRYGGLRTGPRCVEATELTSLRFWFLLAALHLPRAGLLLGPGRGGGAGLPARRTHTGG